MDRPTYADVGHMPHGKDTPMQPQEQVGEPITVRPGLSLAERRLARQQVTDAYVARARRDAARAFRTMTCANATAQGWPPEHHSTCAGELPRNGGCLCECHDASAGAEVLSRTDQP